MQATQCVAPGCDQPSRKLKMCQMHYRRMRKYGTYDLPRLTVEERFWAKVEKTEGCWYWLASRSGGGYGEFAPSKSVKVPAHRFSWTLVNGPIPAGMQIDHLCHNVDPACPGGPVCVHRPCVNPDHLEPVTRLENVRRGRAGEKGRAKTHCVHGHEFTPENTYFNRDGTRSCRACRRVHQRNYELRLASTRVPDSPPQNPRYTCEATQ